ncbi:MAG: S41 family peptidase, partial [Alphaproteobacteria bacterium]|nr:S41 family peptidase [Alphaproteobacteria bacterium]
MRFAKILLTFAMLCIISTKGFAKDSESNNDQVVSLKDASMFFAYVADRIHRDYVEPTKNVQLLEGALNGMLTSLDPHSSYLSPEKYKDIRNQTEGKFAGIGLEVTVENGFIKVISAMEDSPGQRAGLTTADLIIMIDHQPVFGLSNMDAMKKLRGPAGSTVNLVVRRGDRSPFELKIKRDIINIKPIKWRIEDNIGYIRVINFTQNTGSDLRKAIHEIFKKFEGDRPLGFVIDLRNNAGGLFDQGIEVADAFLNNVEIVSVRGRDPKKVHKIMASDGDISRHLPLVVLINGGSASASEIVAGALQDHKRAIIVGTKSFGKGSVQNVIPMTNGGAIKLTTALYYTPSGRSIQKKGIMPDIVVEQQFELKALDEAQRLR